MTERERRFLIRAQQDALSQYLSAGDVESVERMLAAPQVFFHRDSVLSRLGDCLRRQGRHAEAEARYREALSQSPREWFQSEQCQLGLAAVLRRQERSAEADTIRQQAMPGILHWCRTFTRTRGFGDVLAGEDLVDELLEDPLLPGTVLGCGLLGWGLLRRRQYAQAATLFAAGLVAAPADFCCLYGLALAHEELDDPTACRNRLRQAVTQMPEDPDLWEELVWVLLRVHLPELAVTCAQRLVADEPESSRVWELLGEACTAAKDVPGAIAAYRQALAHQPGTLTPYLKLGKLLQELDQCNEALEVYAAAIRDPGAHHSRNQWRLFQVYLGLCLLLRQLGRKTEAEAALQTGMELDL